MIEGFIGIGSLLLIQLIAFAYGYGKLSQKVCDVASKLNSHINDAHLDNVSQRLSNIEGQLKVK